MSGPLHQLPFTARSFRLSVALAGAVLLAPMVTPPTRAHGPDHEADWPMIGHDVANTRSQPFEWRIGPRNVARLMPKWVFTTAGDVSATPAVSARRRRPPPTSPTPRGPLLSRLGRKALEGRRGDRAWSSGRARSRSTTASPNSISRTSPAYARGMIFIGDLNGNMMAVDAATGNLAGSPARSEPEHDRHDVAGRPRQPPLYLHVVGRRRHESDDLSRQHDRPRRAHRPHRLADLSSCPTTAACPEDLPAAHSSTRRPSTSRTASSSAPPDSSTRSPPRSRRVWRWSRTAGTRRASRRRVLQLGRSPSICAPASRDGRSAARAPTRAGSGVATTRRAWCPPWENNFSVWDFAGQAPTCSGRAFEGAGAARRHRPEERRVLGARCADRKSCSGHARRPWRRPGRHSVGHGHRRQTHLCGDRSQPECRAVHAASGETITGGSWAALDPSSGRILWQTPIRWALRTWRR